MLRAMRVLVTGGHGFVGSHLVERLLAAGADVRCLSRHREVPERLRGLPVEVAPGDLASGRGLAEAVVGVEEVWHLGALTRALTPREMFRVNTAGTLALARAARDAGVTRFVFCSSLAAVGPSATGEPLGDDAPRRPQTTYGRSKRAAEEGLLSLDGLPLVILRPPAVYGPRDRDFLALFQGARRGLLPLVGAPTRRLSLIYSSDLAEGLLAVGRAPGARGRALFVTHPEPVRQDALALALARTLGRPARLLRLPPSAARLVGSLASLTAQLTGAAPLLNRERVREVGEGHWVCSAEGALAVAGWRAPTPLEEGLARTAAWYRAEGLL